MLTFFLPVFSPWALTRECISLLSLSGHQTTADSSTTLKRVLFLSRGTQRAWGRHPNRCESWRFRGCHGPHSPWPLASPAFLWLLFSLPLSIEFPPLSWGSGSAEWWLWHFWGRWDTWTQVVVSQIWFSRWYPCNLPPVCHLCDYLCQTQKSQMPQRQELTHVEHGGQRTERGLRGPSIHTNSEIVDHQDPTRSCKWTQSNSFRLWGSISDDREWSKGAVFQFLRDVPSAHGTHLPTWRNFPNGLWNVRGIADKTVLTSDTSCKLRSPQELS